MAATPITTAESTTGPDHARSAEVGRGHLLAQIALALLCWGFLATTARDNDGLWYPADAARHAANGLLYRDYVAAGFPSPRGFVRDYRERFPIVVPTKYPPTFYILEAAAFELFGPAPEVAKGLVLGFALLAALYQVAYLRRFVDPRVGSLGALLPLVPIVAKYSHAIMLNVPAFALQLATIYHVRRWLEERGHGQGVAAAGFGVAAMLCYQGAWVMVLVLASWSVLGGHLGSFGRRGWIALAVIAAILAVGVLGWAMISTEQVRWLIQNNRFGELVIWIWYARLFPAAFGSALLAAAAAGLLVGPLAGYRREVVLSGAWIVVTYLFHTYIYGKDARYLIPFASPLISLAAVALGTADRAIDARFGRFWAGMVLASLIAASAIGSVLALNQAEVPEVRGFRPILDVIEDGPKEKAVLYCGSNVLGSIFTYRIMAEARFDAARVRFSSDFFRKARPENFRGDDRGRGPGGWEVPRSDRPSRLPLGGRRTRRGRGFTARQRPPGTTWSAG